MWAEEEAPEDEEVAVVKEDDPVVCDFELAETPDQGQLCAKGATKSWKAPERFPSCEEL